MSQAISQRIWTRESIIDLLSTNPKALPRAILAIYARQTQEEKSVHKTVISNGKGFNSRDARYLTSIAKALPQYGNNLTPRQRSTALKMMRKYWRQLLEIAEEGGQPVNYGSKRAVEKQLEEGEQLLSETAHLGLSETAISAYGEINPQWTI